MHCGAGFGFVSPTQTGHTGMLRSPLHCVVLESPPPASGLFEDESSPSPTPTTFPPHAANENKAVAEAATMAERKKPDRKIMDAPKLSSFGTSKWQFQDYIAMPVPRAFAPLGKSAYAVIR
jgi:hypothetical protein